MCVTGDTKPSPHTVGNIWNGFPRNVLACLWHAHPPPPPPKHTAPPSPPFLSVAPLSSPERGKTARHTKPILSPRKTVHAQRRATNANEAATELKRTYRHTTCVQVYSSVRQGLMACVRHCAYLWLSANDNKQHVQITKMSVMN